MGKLFRHVTGFRVPVRDLALLAGVSIGTAIVVTGLMLARGALTLTARSLPALVGPLGIGVAAFVGAVALRVGARRRVGVERAAPCHAILREIIFALVLVVPALSLLPLALFLWRTVDISEPALLDKTYLVAAYYVIVLGVPISLLVGSRLAGATGPDIVHDPSAASLLARDASAPWRGLRTPVALVAAALVASYFYGPPWGARPLGGPIDVHESLHFAGLQAIHVGAIPYVGIAGDRFGPGSQLFVFGWMKFVGGFTIQGFRQAFAAQHWLAVVFVCSVVLLFLPVRAAAAALVLAILIFPTFQFFGFGTQGYDGFFGWANVWRYSGVLLLGLALPHALLAPDRGPRWRLVMLGAVWGVTCWLSQENLFGGIPLILAVLLALVLSDSITLVDAGSSLLAVSVGAGIVAAPVLAIYFGLGQAGSFVRNYVLVPLAVSRGYENTPWWGVTPWHTTYGLLPVLTLACGLIAMLRLRPLAIAKAWSQERAVLFGCFIAASVAQSGALLRSDSSHLVNVMVVTPILVGATATLAGSLLELRSATGPLLLAICTILGGWAILPWESSSFAVARGRLTNPWSGRTMPYEKRDGLHKLSDGAAARLGAGYSAWPRAYSSSDKSVGDLVRCADDLRLLVGQRPTYVSLDAPEGQPGLWYFVADLQPFDLPFETASMAFDRAHRAANLRAIADRSRPLAAVVTTKPTAEDSRIAIERLGSAPAAIHLRYGDMIVQVFVASR